MMTSSLFRLLLALALLALPAASFAQRSGEPGRPGTHAGMRGGDDGMRPFHVLLRQRERLGLSDAQVQRLETIRRRLEARNAPLRERLRREHARFAAERRAQLARLTPEQRRDTLRALRERRRHGGPPLPAAMQPLVREMRGNIRTAMDEAQGVLSPEQKRRARQLLARGRRQGREMRQPRERREMREGEAPGRPW